MSYQADPDPENTIELLLAECLERAEPERLRAFERACSTHPERAPELRQRWQALARMGIVDPEPQAAERFPERLGDFRLLRRLGGGGMGVVFLARQESLGREVALKLIRPDQLYFPGVRARFQREAAAIARLSHPGIVPIHVVGEEDGVPYFAMERVVGCTLADALAHLRGRAPESLHGRDLREAVEALSGVAAEEGGDSPFALDWTGACVAIVRQVADALEHAHARGCLHRDVKPSNVMLTPQGRALLVDFGLTTLAGDAGHTRTGAQLGTLAYMAPEQVRAKGEVDARTDVYGAGVTLYEMLSLQVPYRADGSLETQRRILDGRPDALRPRNRAVSADLETVCLVAMDPDPARRYASAGAFARDLISVSKGLPIRARPPSAWRKAWRWVGRHKAASALAATLVATALAVPSIVAYQQYRHAWDTVYIARDKAEQLQYLLEAFCAGTSSTPDRPMSLVEALDSVEQRLDERFGDRPWLAADLRVALGKSYLDLKEFARAQRSLDRALEYFDRHPRTPRQFFHPLEAKAFLAEVLTETGDFERAERLLVEVMPLYDARPDEYSKAGYCSMVLADVLYHTGRFEEAEARLQAALDDASASTDRDLTRALGNLAAAVFERGDYVRSAELSRTALERLDRVAQPDEEDRISILSNLGVALRMQNELGEAESYYDEALERSEKLWNVPSQLVGVLKLNRAGLLEAQGDASAVEGYLEAAETLAEAVGPRSRAVAVARGNAAAMLSRLGRCEEAEQLYGEVLPLQREVFQHGAEAQIPGYSLRNLARCANERGERERAADLLREAIEHMRRCDGAEANVAKLEGELATLEAAAPLSR
jgi:serine/threonine protein kinase/tetratricopeptide (TPR) repeat protein